MKTRTGRTLDVRLTINRSAGFVLDVRFEVEPGVTILFGPSGAGKSSVLDAIAGLVTPSSGRIALGSEIWFDSEANVNRPVHARGVAFVFQSLALFPHLTALGNVAYGMPRSSLPRDRERHALELLERLHVAHVANRKPPTFSGGEAQRVALARAIAIDPRIVLLDEPFSALDHALRRTLIDDVRKLVDELGVPMIHVTHDRDEARSIGERVIVLDGGRVVRSGSIEETLRD